MSTGRKLSALLMGVMLPIGLVMQTGITAQASSVNILGRMVGGVSAVLNPVTGNAAEVINATVAELNIVMEEPEPVEEVPDELADLVMAKVVNALNVRSEADEDSEKVGKLYKDCGGKILERGEEWTKIQSGNLVGWCNNSYLLFDEEARELAKQVGQTQATITTQTLRVRSEATTESSTVGLVPEGEIYEVVDAGSSEEWVCIDFEGRDGYISTEFVDISFKIDHGETMEEIKERQRKEAEAKLNVKYGAYTTDADTTKLLAALIQCEAGGESYEGQVAVGAVVMNRLRSSAYPDTIHGVIYASGQFTPAASGKVDRVYESGKISDSCVRAAEEALAGTSNVGSVTHFRRDNGTIDGIIIGNHVFY